ncbi:MAG: hypothetical protein VKO39_02900 [Cyanobacteriota bacterium]|nr:hypothetical protein [Cyanobacteriota bacterium]
MKPPLFVIAAAMGLGGLAAIPASAALDLLSAGWSMSPASPGECPPPVGSGYDCYEDRTAVRITLSGSNSNSGFNTTSFTYVLPTGSDSESISFAYEFSDNSATAVGYYQINNEPLSAFNTAPAGGSGSIAPFTLNAGDSLTFGINQNGSAGYAGQLAITNFLAVNNGSQAVPFPLPILGPFAILVRVPALRRNARRLNRDHRNQ